MRGSEVRRRALSALCAWAFLGSIPYARAEEPGAPRSGASQSSAVAPRAQAEQASSAPSNGEEALPEAYVRAIDRAVEEHDRGFFQEAREHFRAAHEIFPNARSLRGLGKVEFELRNYGEAVNYLSDALASTVRPLPPPLRTEVEQLLERARAYVGEVHIDVHPGTASVSVDGVMVARGPQAALMLQVGDHLLEFQANGRTPERRFVTVRGKDQIRVRVSLTSPESEAEARSAAPALPERPEQSPPRYRRWVLATAGALLVVGGAVGLGVALARRNDERAAYGGTTDFVLRDR